MKFLRIPQGLSTKRKEPQKDNPFKIFLKLFRTNFLIVVLLSAFINLLLLLPSIYMLAVYDIVIPTQSVHSLAAITTLILLLYLVLFGFQYLRNRILYIAHIKLTQILMEPSFSTNFRLALKKVDNTPRVIDDFNTLRNFLISPGLLALIDIPWTPIFLLFLFILNPLYGFFGIITLLLILGLSILNELLTHKIYKTAQEKAFKNRSLLVQILNNTEAIYGLGMLKNLYKRWESLYNEFIISHDKAVKIGNALTFSVRNLRLIAQTLVYGIGGYLAIHHQITPGMIIAGAIALGRALSPIDSFVASWKNIVSSYMAYKRLNEVLNSYSEEKIFKVKEISNIRGELKLINVFSVAPQSDEPILKNITFQANPGDMIAILGSNGSGKSSLLKTILGIYNVINGKILIDDIDINEWDINFLGKKVGYLPQEIELIEGTVAENIARFGPIIEEEVIKAAKLAGAHKMISSLPDGYNTLVGPNGAFLSGGQRQRIALARALYGNPQILLLDEPDANLDAEGISILANRLKLLREMKKTILVATHNNLIVNLSNKILMLHNGSMVDFGDTAKILEKFRKN